MHIEPAATVTSYGAVYPSGSSEKIFGKHILEVARLGQKAAWDVEVGVGSDFGVKIMSFEKIKSYKSRL